MSNDKGGDGDICGISTEPRWVRLGDVVVRADAITAIWQYPDQYAGGDFLVASGMLLAEALQRLGIAPEERA